MRSKWHARKLYFFAMATSAKRSRFTSEEVLSHLEVDNDFDCDRGLWECPAKKSRTSTGDWWILTKKQDECEMRHAVMAEIHVYRFGKRSSLVDIFIYHVWNIAYRIKKFFGDVIENFSWVKNRCVMNKKKTSS